MASSLSNLVNNFSDGIHKIECKYRLGDKKCENCRIKYKHCECFLEYTNVKGDLNKCKCLCCKTKIINQILMKRNEFLIHKILITTAMISLFYCCENAFILMNIWMIGKNSMKLHYLKKKLLTAT